MKKNFTQIPNMLIKNPQLSDSLFRTYTALRSYAYGKNKAFPSQQRLADDIGKTRETVNRHISELTKSGLVKKNKRGYSMSNEYDFCDDNVTDEAIDNDNTIKSKVTTSSLQKLQKSHTNNTNNKTTNNKGFEKLEETMHRLRLKTKK